MSDKKPVYAIMAGTLRFPAIPHILRQMTNTSRGLVGTPYCGNPFSTRWDIVENGDERACHEGDVLRVCQRCAAAWKRIGETR